MGSSFRAPRRHRPARPRPGTVYLREITPTKKPDGSAREEPREDLSRPPLRPSLPGVHQGLGHRDAHPETASGRLGRQRHPARSRPALPRFHGRRLRLGMEPLGETPSSGSGANAPTSRTAGQDDWSMMSIGASSRPPQKTREGCPHARRGHYGPHGPGPYRALSSPGRSSRHAPRGGRGDALGSSGPQGPGLLMIPEMKTGTSRRAPLSTAALGVLDLSIAHIFGDFL